MLAWAWGRGVFLGLWVVGYPAPSPQGVQVSQAIILSPGANLLVVMGNDVSEDEPLLALLRHLAAVHFDAARLASGYSRDVTGTQVRPFLGHHDIYNIHILRGILYHIRCILYKILHNVYYILHAIL